MYEGRFQKEKSVSPEPERQRWDRSFVLYLHDLVYMLAVLMLVFLLLFRVIVVSGDSMYETLWDGDYLLLLSSLCYQEPQNGDIVVISKESFDHGAPIVKRVIATEGQLVDIDFEQGIVYVDGVELQEDYIRNLTTRSDGVQFPLTVDEGCIFVLGDNRAVSKDSRDPQIGLIDTREVLGKAVFLLLPGTHHSTHPRDYDRIGALQ